MKSTQTLPSDQFTSYQALPMGSLASHILGYVGSGYQADDEGLEGQDLGTFEIKGKKGKEGIEVFFRFPTKRQGRQ